MSYGRVILPPPDAGWYVRYVTRVYAGADDGFGCLMVGLFVGIATGTGALALLAEGMYVWGTLLALAFATCMVGGSPILAVRRVGIDVPDRIRCKGDSPYSAGGLQPATTWRWYREIREPHLREAAEPVWRAFLACLAAYAADADRRHADAAWDRHERIRELSKLQDRLDAAVALTRAGGGVDSTEDLERADALLAALKELEWKDVTDA